MLNNTELEQALAQQIKSLIKLFLQVTEPKTPFLENLDILIVSNPLMTKHINRHLNDRFLHSEIINKSGIKFLNLISNKPVTRKRTPQEQKRWDKLEAGCHCNCVEENGKIIPYCDHVFVDGKCTKDGCDLSQQEHDESLVGHPSMRG